MQRVCKAARNIPPGRTATYAELAVAVGQPNATRAVGRALGKNPIPLIIPCHRVLAARGKPGGFSAHGGRVTKAKLLAIEGAVVNLCLDLSRDYR
ncbi:MAG: MGMT family protein [Terriglobia bacterium]